MRRHIEAFRDSAGRVVGRRAGHTFVRTARGRHFLKRPPAVSLDAAVCDRIFRECTDLRVVNLDSGIVYGISVEDFCANLRQLDRGFGQQYMVPLHHWRVIAEPIASTQIDIPPADAVLSGSERQLRLI